MAREAWTVLHREHVVVSHGRVVKQDAEIARLEAELAGRDSHMAATVTERTFSFAAVVGSPAPISCADISLATAYDQGHP